MRKFWNIQEVFKIQNEIEKDEIILIGDKKYRRAIVPWFNGFIKDEAGV